MLSPTLEAGKNLDLLGIEPTKETTKSASKASRVRVAVFLGVVVFLGGLAVGLVVWDRWLFSMIVKDWVYELACGLNLFCNKLYPEYFILITPALILLAAVLWLWAGRINREAGIGIVFHGREPIPDEGLPAIGSRRWKLSLEGVILGTLGLLVIFARTILGRNLPGWELVLMLLLVMGGLYLREGPVGRVRRFVAGNWRWMAAYLIFHSLLLLMFQRYHTSLRFNWLYAALPLIFGIVSFRWLKSTPVILWFFTIGIVFGLWNINAWWSSAIGDEYEFWFVARRILTQQTLPEVARNLLSASGVYGAHPFFSSVIQAVFMKVFGLNGFGWRISSMYLSMLSSVFLYLALKSFVERRIALAAGLLLATAHYLLSFGKIGKNNLQALFFLCVVIWAATVAVRSRDKFYGFALTGICLGMCFYVYPAALYAVPIPLLLLLMYTPPLRWEMILRWLVMLGTMLALITPLLIQPQYWVEKIPGTFLMTMDWINATGGLGKYMWRSFTAAFFSFLFLTGEDHFVSSSIIDPVSGMFFMFGGLFLLRFAFRKRFTWFFLLSYLVMVFLAGATHGCPYPPGTRIFMILPWLVTAAAVGLFWILELVKFVWRGSTRIYWIHLYTILEIILLANVYQANVVAVMRGTGEQSLQTLFLRILQRAETIYPDDPRTFIFLTDDQWSSVPTQHLPDYYPLQSKFGEYVLEEAVIPTEAVPVLKQPDTYVIICPQLNPEMIAALGEQLLELGKEPCEILTTNNISRFQLWHPPDEDELCR